MMNETMIRELTAKIERYQNGHTIHGPLDKSISPLDRAMEHQFLLEVTYGIDGHPGLAQRAESLMADQQEGKMLTWLLHHKGQAVGMANIEMQDGVAELCRTCKVPIGTVLMNGEPLVDEVKNTAVMYQRLVDFFRMPEALDRIYALQADLRLATEIPLPDGKNTASGVRTQHINADAGFKPFLLCVPRYQVAPKNWPSHQEPFLQSRIYIQSENVHPEPIYTPDVSTSGVISIGDIAKTTYGLAFPDRNTEYLIRHNAEEKTSEGAISVEPTAGIHFSTVRASGTIQVNELSQAVQAGLAQSRFVEIVIENKPENIVTQEIAYKLGLIPLGVIPGGDFTIQNSTVHVSTTIHFGMARPEIRKHIVDIELAKEYKGTPIEQLTKALHQQWKTL